MMRNKGVNWTRNTVTAIERGKRKVSMGEVMALLTALPVTAHDFFRNERISMIQLAGDVHMDLMTFADTLMPLSEEGVRGHIDWLSINALPPERSVNQQAVIERILDSGEPFEAAIAELSDLERYGLSIWVSDAERRAAKRFDVSAEVVLLASHALWGASLEDVRDRDGKGGNAEKGHRTRDLYEQLSEEIERRR